MINNETVLLKINSLIDNLMNMGGANYDDDKLLSVEEIIKTGNCSRDFGIEEWDWPQGVGLYGIYKLQEYYGDDRYMDFFIHWYERNLKIGLPSRNINTTAPYLTLIAILDKMPEKEKYELLCIEHAKWLVESLPRTKENGFQHVTTGIGDRNAIILNESQLWLDTLFMTLLFLNKMAIRYDNDLWRETAEYQVMLHIKYLFDKQTGLFYHGWSFDRNDNFGGIFWCRGNSWYTIAIIEFIQMNPKLSKSLKQFCLTTFTAQLDALKLLQNKDGLWHTVIDDSSSYVEASGSAGIIAGIINAINHDMIDPSYMSIAKKGLTALLDSIDENGTMDNVSAGTAMGMNAQHYKDIQIKPMAYGQALALIALIESLNSKTI